MTSRLILSCIITALSIFCIINSSHASDIVSIQSLDIKPYNDALNGFKKACRCKTDKLILTDLYGIDIEKEIRKNKPDIILSIGIKALKSVREITDIPIISLMVLKPQSYTKDRYNITGVDMFIPPKKQLAEITKVIPHIKTIGLLYDPSKTGEYVKNAEQVSSAYGISLIAKKVTSSKEIPSLMNSMKDSIDAFWVLPDLTVATPESLEYFSLFSIDNNIPVISFSSTHLKTGALLSIDIDSFDMGRQAWDIADKIISNGTSKKVNISYARTLQTNINQKTAKNFGMININNRLIRAVASNRE